MRSGRAVCAGVVALVLAAAGCGGDDESYSAPSAVELARLSREEYVKEATRLCVRERERIAERIEPVLVKIDEGEASPELVRQTVEEEVLPGFRAQYEGLRALVPPWEDADFVDLMLLKLSRSIEDGEEDLAKFFRIKPSTYSEFVEGALMSRELGIRGCGSLRRSPAALLEDF